MGIKEPWKSSPPLSQSQEARNLGVLVTLELTTSLSVFLYFLCAFMDLATFWCSILYTIFLTESIFFSMFPLWLSLVLLSFVCFYFPVSFTLIVFHVFPFPFFHPSAQNFSAAIFHVFCQSSPSFFFFFNIVVVAYV